MFFWWNFAEDVYHRLTFRRAFKERVVILVIDLSEGGSILNPERLHTLHS